MQSSIVMQLSSANFIGGTTKQFEFETNAAGKFVGRGEHARPELFYEYDFPVFGDRNDVTPVFRSQDVEAVGFLVDRIADLTDIAFDDLEVREVEESLLADEIPASRDRIIF